MREDWIECTLGDLFVLIKNGSNIKQTENITGIPVSRIETIWNEGIDWNRVKYALDFDENKHSQYLLIENDILFSHINSDSHLGKTAIFREKNKKLIHGINLLLMRPHSDLVGLFLLYFLRFHKYSGGFLNIAQRSVNQSSINQTSLKKVALKIPSKTEQRAIVKKLESLLSSLDAGVADLKKAQQQLKIYRQTVLKKAFEGKWDKKKIIETCSNIKVGIVIKPTQFYSSDNTGVKAFRSANVKEFRIQDSNWVYFSSEGNEFNKRTKVKEDDILIVRTGYPGTSCVVTKEYANNNAIDILIATPDKSIVLPKYLCAFNNSPYGKGLFSEGSRGVAQKHLNVGVYGNLNIPIPPIKNQLEIIKQLESRLSVCDSIEENIKESLEKAEALRQSILKKAFEGNLLTVQELAECKLAEDYETAGVLLEKIKADKIKK